MHGYSGLNGLKRNGLEADAMRVFWFLVVRLFCLFRFGSFESGLKKDLTETEIAVECIGSTGRIDCPSLFNKMNRNNLCGYVSQAVSVRNSRYRIHVNSQE